MPPLYIAATLRAMTWRDLAGWAFAALALTALAKAFAPAAAKPLLRDVGLALPLLLLAAKDIAHAPQAWQRLRRAHAYGAPWHARVAALLPPELLGIFKLDRLLWLGCLRQLQGRAVPDVRPDGVTLTYLERGAYGTARAVVFTCLLFELPVHALLLHVFVKDPHTLLLVHVLGGVTVLYTLAWLLGDRWHIGTGRHVLTADALHLRVGIRADGRLPLAAIARMEKIDMPLPAWRQRHDVARANTLVVTPFDQPNCVLVLRRDAQADILLHQSLTCLPQYVFLYLDRPELLAARLREPMATDDTAC